MTYKELIFTLLSAEDFHKDLIIDALAGIGFDSFTETDDGFKAYISSSDLDQTKLDMVLESFRDMVSFSYQVKLIPHENWNTLWENNFEPLHINEKCYIRATFHEPHPEYEYEIVIDPKMAFGTGHHQTTALMLGLMMEEDFKSKKVLDMGSGTGILAIMASKLGAEEVLAIDHDEVSYQSTMENAALNKIFNLKVLCGSKEAIPDQKFDIILANINRNILLDQIDRYQEALTGGGIIFLSGFYEDPDLTIIKKKALHLGLLLSQYQSQDEWVAAKFIYKN